MKLHLTQRTDYLLTGLLTAVPVVVFTLIWAYYAVNIPKWDDHALKSFLLELEGETDLKGKIYQFFKQHNEHRIVLDRVVTYLDYHLFGKLNYLRLMTVGNLSLLGLVVLFGAVLRRAGQRLLYVVPVTFILVNLAQWENMFWGMAALQNFTVVLWVLWSLYALTHQTSLARFGLAFSLAVLATLTSGNGLLIWPIGAGLLLLQRRWQGLILWAVGTVIVILLYFTGYAKPAGNPPVRGSAPDLLLGWLAFNGSAGEVMPVGSPFGVCVLLGGVITTFALGLAGYRLWRQRPTYGWHTVLRFRTGADHFFAGSVAFLLGTGAIVAWSRVGFGLEMLMTSRYKIYSLTLLAVLYVYGVITVPDRYRRSVGGWGLTAAVGLAYLSYPAFLDETIWWRQYLTTSQFNWTYTANVPRPAIDTNTARFVNNAPAFYDSHLPALYANRPDSTRRVTPTDTQRHTLTLDLTAPDLIPPVSRDAGTYVTLRSARRLYVFSTTPHRNGSIGARLGLGPLFAPGFSTRVREIDVEPDTYAVGVLMIDAKGNRRERPLNEVFVATGQSGSGIEKNW